MSEHRRPALFRCIDCRQDYHSFAPIDVCQQCGGTVRQAGAHPLAGHMWPSAPPVDLADEGQLILFGFDVPPKVSYNEGMIQEHVMDLLEGIGRYLAAYVEMDRYTNEEA